MHQYGAISNDFSQSVCRIATRQAAAGTAPAPESTTRVGGTSATASRNPPPPDPFSGTSTAPHARHIPHPIQTSPYLPNPDTRPPHPAVPPANSLLAHTPAAPSPLPPLIPPCYRYRIARTHPSQKIRRKTCSAIPHPNRLDSHPTCPIPPTCLRIQPQCPHY